MPITWKDVMNVFYMDIRTQVTGALTVEPAIQTGTRGTAISYQDFTIAQTTLTISNFRFIPMFIDEADRYQQAYFGSPEVADFQGKLINEYLEAQMLAQHASFVDFGQGDLDNTAADSTVRITVSATNIANIVRALKRKIYVNNGLELATENGMFSIWRPADREFLEQFAMSAGFSEADLALKEGIPSGRFYYMGMWHYLSTNHTANHVFAGVRKVGKDLGILRGSFGKVKYVEDPPGSSGGVLSGLGIHSRLDYGFAFPSDATPAAQRVQQMCIDLNVN